MIMTDPRTNTWRRVLLTEAARKREKALQARRLAAGVARRDPAAMALRDYARELEGDAVALDRQAEALSADAEPPLAANGVAARSAKRRASG